MYCWQEGRAACAVYRCWGGVSQGQGPGRYLAGWAPLPPSAAESSHMQKGRRASRLSPGSLVSAACIPSSRHCSRRQRLLAVITGPVACCQAAGPLQVDSCQQTDDRALELEAQLDTQRQQSRALKLRIMELQVRRPARPALCVVAQCDCLCQTHK